MNNESNKNDLGINLSGQKDKKKYPGDKFNFSLWFLKNRKIFFVSFIFFLAAISVFLYSYFFYNLYDYIRYSDEERRSLQELSSTEVSPGASRLANPIQESIVQSFFHNDKYDFVAKVKNPNNNFFANITYCFVDNGQELACSGSILFPDEDKYLLILSVKLDSRPNNLKFIIKNISWERVDIRKYQNWPNYYSERVNFLINDIEFSSIPAPDSSLKSSNNLSFSIKNNSPYNYWSLPLSIIIFNRSNIIGINKYTISEFMSLESKKVNLSWSNSISSSDKIEIIPDLNILQENNYIKYK